MACEFRNELLNFATNVQTSQQTSGCCSEKSAEIDNNILQNLKLSVTESKWFTYIWYLSGYKLGYTVCVATDYSIENEY